MRDNDNDHQVAISDLPFSKRTPIATLVHQIVIQRSASDFD